MGILYARCSFCEMIHCVSSGMSNSASFIHALCKVLTPFLFSAVSDPPTNRCPAASLLTMPHAVRLVNSLQLHAPHSCELTTSGVEDFIIAVTIRQGLSAPHVTPRRPQWSRALSTVFFHLLSLVTVVTVTAILCHKIKQSMIVFREGK